VKISKQIKAQNFKSYKMLAFLLSVSSDPLPHIFAKYALQGCILRAPSIRITSPFIIGFSIMDWASCAYSAGLPSRAGNGTVLAKNDRTLSGRLARSGVSNKPGKQINIL
jgi:hypothetical protein